MKSDVKTCNDNTKPEFFAQWSLRDLQVECARLNQVLKEIRELAPPKTLTKETKTCVTKDTPL